MNKLFKWLVFGVAFALAPIIADYFLQSVRSNPRISFNWHDVLVKGELLLVCAGISGGGVGELIGTGRDWLPFKIVCGGTCMLILFIAVVLYTGVASDIRLGASYNKAMVAERSISIFVATLLASLGCILSSEN